LGIAPMRWSRRYSKNIDRIGFEEFKKGVL